MKYEASGVVVQYAVQLFFEVIVFEIYFWQYIFSITV